MLVLQAHLFLKQPVLDLIDGTVMDLMEVQTSLIVRRLKPLMANVITLKRMVVSQADLTLKLRVMDFIIGIVEVRMAVAMQLVNSVQDLECNYPDTITDYINSCKNGTTFADRIDDNDYYKWACGDETCKRLKPFHGECSSTTKNQCARGVAGTVSKQVESYANSGYYILPEVPNPKATSKTINENEKYDLSTLDEIWSCEGGASKVYCRQTQSFNGVCPTDPPEYNAKNDFINYCKQGYVTSQRDSTDEYTWNCNASTRGTRDNCTRQKLDAPPASQIKSQGECSATRSQCRGGTVNNRKTKSITAKYNNGRIISDRPYSLYTWECTGSGSSATTQKCKDISSLMVGECDNTEVDQCAGGILYNLDDSDTHYRWLCFGSTPRRDQRNKGNIVYCSKPKFQVIEDDEGVQSIQPF